MWEDSSYCWVVICQSYFHHMKQNLFHGHRIALGVTDAVNSRPAIDQRFVARCDDCGKEYVYKPSEVFRYEQEPPEQFRPHPLFQEET